MKTDKDNIYNFLNAKQREFIQYVLRNYVAVGIDELDVNKLSTILTARYGSMHAAQRELGTVKEIRATFIDFQQYLYEEAAA